MAQTSTLMPVFLPDIGRGGLVVDGEYIPDLLDEFEFSDDEPSEEDLAAIEEEGDGWE